MESNKILEMEPKIEKEYSLGIKINGALVKINTIGLESDKSQYDYTCSVLQIRSSFGNGDYSINITDQKFNNGCILEGWKISSGSIIYWWNYSKIYFDLIDKEGEKIKSIEASRGGGSLNGFDIVSMINSIFSTAIKVISEYPTAEIYKLHKSLENFERSLSRGNNDCLLDYLRTYGKAIKYLSSLKDDKSISLLKEIQQKACEIFVKLKDE